MTIKYPDNVKRRAIVSHIRRRIVAGKLAPGARLPNRTEMERTFGVSMPTVQKAFDELIRDGFLSARRGRGTFVTQRPPHLWQYGLVFPAHWRSRFYLSLRQAARQTAEHRDIRLNDYVQHDPPSVQRLVDDVAARRLAGLLIVHPQWDVWDTPIMKEPGVARVVLAGSGRNTVPAVDIDMCSFYERALDHLIACGRRRVALLFPDTNHSNAEDFSRAATARGLDVRPYWLAAAGLETTPRAVSCITRLLAELSDSKRPDALVIDDDNLVELAVGGLMASGIRVPDELQIVAHCNFPLPVSSGLPMRRLGFDCTRMLQTALDLLEAQRGGRKPALLTRLAALFESEADQADELARRTASRTRTQTP